MDHKQSAPSIYAYVESVFKTYAQHSRAWIAKNIQIGENKVRHPDGYHLITFDVANRKEGSILASICWKDNGEVLFAKTDFINNVRSNQEEANAALMAIKEAERLNLEKIVLEGDSSVTI